MVRGPINSLRWALSDALDAMAERSIQPRRVKAPRGANWSLETSRSGGNPIAEAIINPDRYYLFTMRDKFGENASDLHLSVNPDRFSAPSLKRLAEDFPMPGGQKVDDERGIFLRNALRALIRHVDEVSWNGWTAADMAQGLTKSQVKRERSRYGLAAMRNVANALEYDARKFKPKWYSFYGATDAHDKLYASLAKRMRRSGYHMISPDGHHFFLRRASPNMAQRIASDLAMTAPLGVAGYYASAPEGDV